MSQRVCVITGGSSGIGLALAHRYAQAGYSVAITGRDAPALEVARKAISQHGSPVLALPGDVTSLTDCIEAAAQVYSAFGPATVVIANAGISMRALFSEVEPSVLRRLMDVNFFGTVHTAKAFLPHLVATKGSLVGISSIAGYRGLPARTGYSASKAAMQAFLESLRAELYGQGIHILTACPGFTASAIRTHALNAAGQPQGASPLDEATIMPAETVANAIYNAQHARKRDLVLTRQGKLTVLLNKWLPGFMDKKVYKVFAKEKDSPLR
jgi:dehydrogenase/reductase SDR family member 7B